MKITKRNLIKLIKEVKLNESQESLVDDVDAIEQKIWYKIKDKKIKDAWDKYTENLFEKKHAKYWSDIENFDLQRAKEYGTDLLAED